MLANDAYWLTHNDWTGALRTSDRSAGVMMAAALLGELIAVDAVGVRSGLVVALLPSPKLDRLGAAVLKQVTDERARHSVGQWLEFLAPDVDERVSDRMISAGEARGRRVGLLRRTLAVARDGDNGPAWVHSGLVNAVREGEELTADQRFLLWLLWYSSIEDHPLDGVSAPHIEFASEQVRQIDGEWRLLLETAVGLYRTAAVAR